MKKHLSLWTLKKSISWRIFATAFTGLITYIVTGQIDTAMHVTFWEATIKTALFYIHDRIWETLKP